MGTSRGGEVVQVAVGSIRPRCHNPIVVAMAGRSGGRSRPGRPPLPPPLLVKLLLLLPLLLLTGAVAQLFEDDRRFRMAVEQRRSLKTGEVTLPVEAYLFDEINLGQREIPKTLKEVDGVSVCHCRHLCLTEPTCTTYVHSEGGGTCSMHDFLMPEDTTAEFPPGRTVGRRRGISWLGASCSSNASCSLLTRNAECGPERTCVCSLPGWTEADKTLCRPEGRWRTLASGSLDSALLLGETETPSETQCMAVCRRSDTCWAYSFSEATLRCRRYAAGALTGAIEQEPNTTSGVWEFGQPDGAPPEGYLNVSNRLFRMTSPIRGDRVAAACLELGGVPYAPDHRDLMVDVATAFSNSRFFVGLNDRLVEGRFEAADGMKRSLPWADKQPDTGLRGVDQTCVFFSQSTAGLHGDQCDIQYPGLCEYIGPDLLTSGPSRPRDDAERRLTWWTFDLQQTLQVSRLLYLAGNTTARPLLTQVRLGHHPEAVDDQSSVLCFSKEGALAADGFSLRLACEQPRSGRFLHVGQQPGGPPLWEKLAVYGN